MKSAPCLGCDDRALYCHSYCQEYQEYEKLRENIRKENREMSTLNGMVLHSMKRFSGRIIKEL